MTDATCANMGFPNVFNNPPPPTPMTSYNGPVYANGIFGLFEGPHPTMIYPGQPIICRQGVDCPGDAPAPAQIPDAADHARHIGHHHGHRVRQVAQ